MCNIAAHLIDRVLPSFPVRQWVLLLPLAAPRGGFPGPVVRWLRKNGLMDARPAQERSNEPSEGGAVDAYANVALGGGTLVRLDAEGAIRKEIIAASSQGAEAHSRRRSTGSICRPRCVSRLRMMTAASGSQGTVLGLLRWNGCPCSPMDALPTRQISERRPSIAAPGWTLKLITRANPHPLAFAHDPRYASPMHVRSRPRPRRRRRNHPCDAHCCCSLCAGCETSTPAPIWTSAGSRYPPDQRHPDERAGAGYLFASGHSRRCRWRRDLCGRSGWSSGRAAA